MLLFVSIQEGLQHLQRRRHGGHVHVESCLREVSVSFETLEVRVHNSDHSRAWLSPLTYSVYIAGYMSGPPVLGAFADSKGRKSAIFVCHAAVVAANQLGAVTQR